MTNKTHFGYQTVSDQEKTEKVNHVFHSVAQQYDLMNDFMSFGVHRWWKKFTVNQAHILKGHQVLDIAGGTGDLAAAFAKQVGKRGQVVLADMNSSMLQQGRDRFIDAGTVDNVAFIQANAEELPFADDYFDRITIAFGLRNVTHLDKALASMFRVLKPGGKLLILEFSKAYLPGLKNLYDWYSFHVLPKLGQWVVGDADSYQYLVESIRMFPDQKALSERMAKAGFEDCQYFNLTGGIVTLHQGYKY
jgi:demethylmenaquinone methyltransferase/2-methoxy-6-polyprenyl-1,4-benzoquinol methylase